MCVCVVYVAIAQWSDSTIKESAYGFTGRLSHMSFWVCTKTSGEIARNPLTLLHTPHTLFAHTTLRIFINIFISILVVFFFISILFFLLLVYFFSIWCELLWCCDSFYLLWLCRLWARARCVCVPRISFVSQNPYISCPVFSMWFTWNYWQTDFSSSLTAPTQEEQYF